MPHILYYAHCLASPGPHFNPRNALYPLIHILPLHVLQAEHCLTTVGPHFRPLNSAHAFRKSTCRLFAVPHGHLDRPPIFSSIRLDTRSSALIPVSRQCGE